MGRILLIWLKMSVYTLMLFSQRPKWSVNIDTILKLHFIIRSWKVVKLVSLFNEKVCSQMYVGG